MKECIKERTAVTRNNNRSEDKLQIPPKFIFIIHYNPEKVNTRRKIVFKAF